MASIQKPEAIPRWVGAALACALVLGWGVWARQSQEEAAQSANRRYAAEQWELSRMCLVGSGTRGDSLERVMHGLRARAEEAEVIEDAAFSWPSHCLGFLAGVGDVPGEIAVEARAALTELRELLQSHGSSGSAQTTDLEELAQWVSALDRTMPDS